MGRLNTLSRLRDVLAMGNEAALGDIAILKSDFSGIQTSDSLKIALAPVEGYLPALPLSWLRSLPPGSFGAAYAAFLDQNQLKPFTLSDAIDPEMRRRNTFAIRYAVTHDMFHVLLDFGADWPGEMGVLAFAVGQGYSRSQWVAAVFAWLIYPIRSGFAFGRVWQAWRRGYALGKKAPCLLGVRLEERLEEDLGVLRAALGLGPETGKSSRESV